MIPLVTIVMFLHPQLSDSLYFLVSSYQHNVSPTISPVSPSCSSASLALFNTLSPPTLISTFSSLILFCTASHSLFFPSHPSSSGCPCTRHFVALHSFIVPRTQLPTLFLHAWCIFRIHMPFLQLSFITPVLSAFLADSPPALTFRLLLCFLNLFNMSAVLNTRY